MNNKYRIDTAENKAFMQEIRDTLLAFGHRFPAEDGSSYYLGDDGTPWADRPRETWITSRMAHVYSIGCMLGHEGAKELAEAAIKGLRGALHDNVNGGWYAGIRADGSFLPTKQCYAHAFVILAASSAMLAGCDGAEELLRDALAVYDTYFWNEELGLSCDTWNTEFERLDSYRGINANMHTVEAFLAVWDALGDIRYRVRAGRIIDRVIGWAEANEYRIPEHFTQDWVPDLECNQDKKDDPFKPYGATPGHGIEWARLICQWACATAGDTLGSAESAWRDKYVTVAERLYRRAITDAWNADGARGIVYTTDWQGKPIVHDRMHWTLAEAINTSAVLFRLTGKEEYANDYAMFSEYLDEEVLDHKNGSWFHQLDEKNQVMTTVWPGKSDIYHALQATLIPYQDVAVSIATAVATTTSGSAALTASGDASAANSNGSAYDIDVIALGELLIDFTENGISENGNPVLEANPGGAPCNVLAMLQRLGKKTAFIGKVGKDSFGDYLKTTVHELGINTENLLQDATIPTTLAFVHTAPDGDRSFSFYRNPGADMMLSADEIDYTAIENAKIFHFGTLSMTHEGVREATMEALECAKAAGLMISFDPNYRPLLWDDPEMAKEMMRYGFERCDVLKIADDEIMFYTGAETVEAAIELFRKQHCPRLMCVTLGREGSIAFLGDYRVECPAKLREDTIETTGAGDTFMACVLNAVLEQGLEKLTEESIHRMLEFAGCAASIITTRRGALRVMPTRENIESELAGK